MVLHFRRLAHALKQREKARALGTDRSWFAPAAVMAGVRKVIEIVSREMARPFETHLPVYSLRAAAGKFGEGQEVNEEGWVRVEGIGRLDRSMFVARAVGRSMEPLIQDGDYLVFRADPVGSRQGKIVLVQHRGQSDPETGGAYTVKRYSSKREVSPTEEWRHTKIALLPVNPEFSPIVLEPNSQDDIRLIAEFVSVLK